MLGEYLRISKPLRWPLLLGSFFIGAIASDTTNLFWPALAVFAFYFSFPANLLIYGINDIFDYQADQHNPHKRQSELTAPGKRMRLINVIILWNLPFTVVWLADEMPTASKFALMGFLFLGIFYSAKPIRAKTKPFLDTLFYSLFIFPGLFAYGLLEYTFPPWQIIVAASLWCMAAHAYTAIPDVNVDRKAGIRTIATTLRPLGTLFFCMLCYAGAAVLSYPWLKLFSVGAGVFYLLLMLATFVRSKPESRFFLYRWFTGINVLAGIALFVYIAVVTK